MKIANISMRLGKNKHQKVDLHTNIYFFPSVTFTPFCALYYPYERDRKIVDPTGPSNRLVVDLNLRTPLSRLPRFTSKTATASLLGSTYLR